MSEHYCEFIRWQDDWIDDKHNCRYPVHDGEEPTCGEIARFQGFEGQWFCAEHWDELVAWGGIPGSGQWLVKLVG